MHTPRRVLLITGGLILAAGVLLAAPSEKPAPKADTSELYEQGMEATRAGNHAEALRIFTKADALKPNDPDIVNMLAYSTRKTGKLDEARVLYLKALSLRPRFPEAREYLGECYLELARQQLDLLKSYGDQGQAGHEQLSAAIRALAQSLDTGEFKPPEPRW